MSREIERKFLVATNAWVPRDPGVHLTQGYLNSQKARVVRVRIEGPRAVLTVKGPTTGIRRAEFEYAIPLDDAREMLDQLCERPLIDKHRHVEIHNGLRWEIDVFHGENEGLVVAEVELPSADALVEPPSWAVEDVSDDPRYFNSNLLTRPFSTWPRT
jgi:adenylate cyclase